MKNTSGLELACDLSLEVNIIVTLPFLQLRQYVPRGSCDLKLIISFFISAFKKLFVLVIIISPRELVWRAGEFDSGILTLVRPSHLPVGQKPRV